MITDDYTVDTTNLGTAHHAAERIVQRVLVGADGCVVFPVELSEVTDDSVSVSVAPLDQQIAGLVIQLDAAQQVEIFLNAADSLRQRRSTWAHLLGHTLLTREAQQLVGRVAYRHRLSIGCPDPVEQWCRTFSDALLMPGFAVRNMWSRGRTVSKIATVFGVAESTVARRLAFLGLHE